jgi:oxidoreductase, short-chain dehydrogenase/reductase family
MNMKIAVVTGASSGIGKRLAERLYGYFTDVDEIWVIARSREKLLNLRCGVKTKVIPLDLQLYESILTLERLFKQHKPDIRVLINCAGFGKFGSYNDIELDSSLGMIDLNCRALVGVTEAALPYMGKGSRILQVCSISAFQPLPMLNVYAASKAFVLSYSLALSEEVKPRGIYLTVLCPNWVNTEFFKVAENTKNPGAIKSYPFIMSPERVANTALSALKAGRLMKIPGVSGKILYAANKIIPKRAIMRLWLMNCNKKSI